MEVSVEEGEEAMEPARALAEFLAYTALFAVVLILVGICYLAWSHPR